MNPSVLKDTSYARQHLHLEVPNCHSTSIIEYWCFKKPIASSTRLRLNIAIENNLVKTSLASSLLSQGRGEVG